MLEIEKQPDVSSASKLEIQPDDFSRRFSMRPGSLMWFLGAGASAAAGIPTAGDMIWEFKQKLFVSQRRAPPEMVAVAAELNLVSQWWVHRLAAHVIDGLWSSSFHVLLPIQGPAGAYVGDWADMRKLFIASLTRCSGTTASGARRGLSSLEVAEDGKWRAGFCGS